MKALISILFIVILFSGCGAKKKLVTEIKSSAEVNVQENRESRSETRYASEDTTRTVTKEVEENREKVIEEYIFNDSGRVVSYRRETNREVTRNTDTDIRLGVNTDSIRIDSMKEQIKIDSMAQVLAKEKNKEVKSYNPIYYWIGGGLLLAIVLIVFRKFYLPK